MTTLTAYEDFRTRCELSRTRLVGMLETLQKEGKRVIGYAATSKSTTVINFCGISPKLLEFISDTTPLKQGKFSPGMHIPVKPDKAFRESYPDYARLFGWNHENEILQKEGEYRAQGGGKSK